MHRKISPSLNTLQDKRGNNHGGFGVQIHGGLGVHNHGALGTQNHGGLGTHYSSLASYGHLLNGHDDGTGGGKLSPFYQKFLHDCCNSQILTCK